MADESRIPIILKQNLLMELRAQRATKRARMYKAWRFRIRLKSSLDESTLKYSVNWPTSWPKMTFIRGMVIPAPIEATVATA